MQSFRRNNVHKVVVGAFSTWKQTSYRWRDIYRWTEIALQIAEGVRSNWILKSRRSLDCFAALVTCRPVPPPPSPPVIYCEDRTVEYWCSLVSEH
jgi:hypothetical protein